MSLRACKATFSICRQSSAPVHVQNIRGAECVKSSAATFCDNRFHSVIFDMLSGVPLLSDPTRFALHLITQHAAQTF